MMDIVTPTQVSIEVSGIEVIELKKLSLVSHALASKLSHSASAEQRCLATVLDDVIRRIELSAAMPSAEGREQGEPDGRSSAEPVRSGRSAPSAREAKS